ncbi:hypothetical protein BKA66DRAFT_472282 [Pyrenochaeta sp. MPI-SDFR-AT-0127]|nr:hypothetical protein BKA66DRAFT_472282 [Pyrenochaeta sp. MPI-SDFR-AT-0127]
MPLCTLHLLALHGTTPNPLLTFLSTLKSSNVSPLVISRVIRWIILPSQISTEHLLAQNIHWDLLLILPNTRPLPSELQKLVQHQWNITAGVPSRLIQDFSSKNNALLHPNASSVPALSTQSAKRTTQSSQDLELSDELNQWIDAFVQHTAKEGTGAVSMFNLLSFNPGMKDEYLKYGKAFAESIGSRHGGNAKIVGNVVAVNGKQKHKQQEEQSAAAGIAQLSTDGQVRAEPGEWDEISLAHYPSICHFRDMLTSEAYQAVNKRHRVPSLRDTCILMTSEVGVEEMVVGGGKGGAKL